MNDLSLKLKKAVIEELTNSFHDLDKGYLSVGQKTYTRRELGLEIENETELGIDLLSTAIKMSLDRMSRNLK